MVNAIPLIRISDEHVGIRHVLGGILSGIIILIYLPMCTYGVSRYLYHKDWIVMRKRYQWITIFMLINLVLSIVAIGLLMVFGFALNWIPDLYSGYFLLYPMLLMGVNIGWKTLWRNWSYYYDVMWIQAISNKEWKALINEEEAANDWFLQNKGKYGKWQYFSIPYLVVVAIDAIFLTMWEYLLPDKWHSAKGPCVFGTAVFLLAIPLSLLIYLRRKTPIFYDNFAIRNETIFVIYALTFGMFCVIVCVTAVTIIDTDNDESAAELILDMIGYFLWATVYMVLIYVSTIWVVKRNAIWLRQNSDSLAGIVAVKDDWDVTDTFLRVSSGGADYINSTTIPLPEILSNPTSYATFVQHLSTEFNVESLLSLTEFVQFQQLIWEWLRFHDIEDHHDLSSSSQSGRRSTSASQIPLFKRLKFGDGIPRSSIVYGRDTKETYLQMGVDTFHGLCKEKALRLFVKYISYESKFQILIDFETSRAMCQLMENEERWMRLSVQEFTMIDLLYLFEEATDDMHTMMQDAYKRFQRTNSFEKLHDYVYQFTH